MLSATMQQAARELQLILASELCHVDDEIQHTSVTRWATHKLCKLLGDLRRLKDLFGAPPIPELRVWVIQRVLMVLRS